MDELLGPKKTIKVSNKIQRRATWRRRDPPTLSGFVCKQVTSERESGFAGRGRRWGWPSRNAFSCQTFLFMPPSLTQGGHWRGGRREAVPADTHIKRHFYLSLIKTPSTTPPGKSARYVFCWRADRKPCNLKELHSWLQCLSCGVWKLPAELHLPLIFKSGGGVGTRPVTSVCSCRRPWEHMMVQLSHYIQL